MCCYFPICAADKIVYHLLTYISHYTHRGKGGSLKSCNALLQRVENNDPTLTELVILPMKTFDVDDIERLSSAIGECRDYNMLDALYYIMLCRDDGVL